MNNNKYKVIGNNDGYMRELHVCDTEEQAKELLKYEQKTGKHKYFIVAPKDKELMKISDIKEKCKEKGWTKESPDFWVWFKTNVEDFDNPNKTNNPSFVKNIIIEQIFG